MDAITRNAKRHQLQDRQKVEDEVRRQQKSREAAARNKEREIARQRAEAMALLGSQIDAEVARIAGCIDKNRWHTEAEAATFRRESWRQLRRPEYAVIHLGRVLTHHTASWQLCYDVYLRIDGQLFIEPCFHGVPYIAVRGDDFYPVETSVDETGDADCRAILEFLQNWKP